MASSFISSGLMLASAIAHLCVTTTLASPVVIRSPEKLEFDYVIVGSGPGGSVMANRLTELVGVSVAIIEAGTWADESVGNLTTVPAYDGAFLLKSLNQKPSAVDWGFVTTPQLLTGQGVNNQTIRYPRGKVVRIFKSLAGSLGGSSRLNAMAWGESCRGAFQKWADDVDDQSFTYDKIAQYYKKPVRFVPPRPNTRFSNATPSYDPTQVRSSGPIGVTYAAYAYSWTTWLATMLDAAGLKSTNSFMDGTLNGSAWHMSAVDQTTGTRCSADVGYLRPILEKSTLSIFDNTLAERIIFNDKKVATGVQVSSKNGTSIIRANKEVIIAGGVFMSPQLLQLIDLGVGQNMHDQVFADIVYRVNLPTGSTLGITEADINTYQKNATGPLSNPGGEFGGFEKIPADLRLGFSKDTAQILHSFPKDWPEIQYLSLPQFLGDLGTTIPPKDGHNYASLMGTLMTPTSRGNVRIASSSMRDAPLIDPAWLTTKADLEVMVAIFKRMRQIWTGTAIQKITVGDEAWPGPSVKTDEDIVAFLKQTATPMSHATSTNKMGKKSDPLAVVDSQCKVLGVKNLRVIDGSAVPFLPPGEAPQSAIYMLAEKIADVMKKDH
ncbi:hypothetical protein SNOG_06686 [Parastagonospora nodorum SN15]|uniref:Glucose-methanol-choline oxidoreductase N-terminal domain-containing protein n=1 Tax=Phaeosphaeria nodorum (strain SN15 / ATCC MYA-4574 / FGSC 10173) TaxID=321614 RepID=Q0UNH8_PHANO|nr:hypothetical protein SNOG_06686 [Parastagonospora nodorum SN15]EAT86517.1 hypothetical protein SNOG_06686 [Parastagonospora nodorum SN15]